MTYPPQEPQPKKLWGVPPIRGTYQEQEYAPAGRFGPREAGSVFANVALLQPVMAVTSFEIEKLAQQAHPGIPTGFAFSSAWLSQVLVTIFLKVFANMLRNFGASFARDFGAWLWQRILVSTFSAVFGWMLPWNWGSRNEPQPDNDGWFPRPDEPRRRRRRWLDIFFRNKG